MKRLSRRSADELGQMRAAGRVVAEMHQAIRAAARPGVTTLHLDRVARDVLAARGATSNFLGYHGFPAVICASVNDEVIHGIPNERPLRDGDIVSIDCGAIVDGWHGDAAFTMGIGAIDDDAQRLIDTADRALAAAIAAMRAGWSTSAMSVPPSKRWSLRPGTAVLATTAVTGSVGRCTKNPTSRTVGGAARGRGSSRASCWRSSRC